MNEPIEEIQSTNYHSRQVVPGDYLQTLLNSLTLDDIRTAIHTLAPSEKISVKSHATSLESVLKTHRHRDDICKALLATEAVFPFKHCLFFRAKAPQTIVSAASEFSIDGFDFKVARISDSDTSISITFEHFLKVVDWEQIDDETRKKITHSSRHPVVFRHIKKSGLASLNYPGLSQGRGVKQSETISYPDVLGALLKALTRMGFESRVISVKNALKTFLSTGSKRMIRIRGDFETAGLGRLDITSGKSDAGIEETLTEMLGRHITTDGDAKRELQVAFKKALNDADHNYLVLYWQEEKIFTRLRYWDIGCEILFIWNGEAPSFTLLDGIIDLLAGTEGNFGDGRGLTVSLPAGWISLKKAGEIFKPSDLAQQFSLPSLEAREHLMFALKAGIIRPVYRLLTTEFLIDIINDWTPDLRALRRIFKTDSGTLIDGSNPNSIEVAFERTAATGEAA